MTNDKKIEQLITIGLDVAEKMIKGHDTVIPFACRIAKKDEDVKLSNHYAELPDADWAELLAHTATNLKEIVEKEDIFSTAIFTALQNGDDNAIGVQVETEKTATVFIYPFEVSEKEEIKISEPIQHDSLFAQQMFTNRGPE